MRIANLLWKANISSEYSHQDNPKFKKQLDETLERGIPFMIVFGQDELDNKVVKLKDMKAHTEEEVPVTDIVNVLMAKSCRVIAAGADLSFIEAMKK